MSKMYLKTNPKMDVISYASKVKHKEGWTNLIL